MKNKLFVRGAVIVVALMLLVSTVAFADATATPELNADNTAIVFADATGAGYTSSEDQVTILAFAVDKGTEASAVAALADGTGVVAINQVAGSVGFTTVPINSAVFDEGGVAYGKDIAVLVGGTDTETPAAYVLSTDAEVVEPTTYNVAYELNGGALAEGVTNPDSFTDAAAFLAALNEPAKADLVEETETATTTTTYTFAGWYLDATFETAATAESLVAGTSTTVTLYANWTSSTTTVDKPVEDDVTVTVMNGTTPIVLTADASGNVTLPTDTAFNKDANEGYTFTLYSWATEDGATEYVISEGTSVAAADLKDVTLYAKYVVNILHGDMDGADGIDETDRTYVHQYITRNRTLGNVTKTFSEVVGVDGMPAFVVGDIDNADGIDETDRTYIHQYITRGRKLGNIGQTVYYVNK